MTDQTVDRHEERIARENRRQALNHAVRLSAGLDRDSTLEAATRFARFLDGGEASEAVPTEPESVQQLSSDLSDLAWANYKANLTDHPPVPVTEQHGATERPIRAMVSNNRNGALRLEVHGPNGEPPDSAVLTISVIVPHAEVKTTGDLVAFLANAINGTGTGDVRADPIYEAETVRR